MRRSISSGVMVSSRLHEDLLPDRCFVIEDPFAAEAPGSEFGVADAEHIDLRAGRLAEGAEALVLAVEAPAERGAGWHGRVLAADPVVDAEGRVRECRAQAQEETVDRPPAVASRAARHLDLHGAVVDLGN